MERERAWGSADVSHRINETHVNVIQSSTTEHWGKPNGVWDLNPDFNAHYLCDL